MPFIQRDERSYWWNESPFIHVQQVLDILTEQNTSIIPPHLTHNKDRDQWEIVVPWARDKHGYPDSGENYYQIDQDLAKQMVEEKLVRPRTVPQWGFTETRQNELIVTESAKRDHYAFYRRMREKAESMLIRGRDTNLIGDIVPKGHYGEHWDGGRLYFEYETPTSETCRIYPEQDERICPYLPAPKSAVDTQAA